MRPHISVRGLVCLSVGWLVLNAFFRFDELTTFLNEIKFRRQLGGRSKKEVEATRRKEQRGERNDEEGKENEKIEK